MIGFKRDGTNLTIEASIIVSNVVFISGAEVLARGSYAPGSGPIFLSQLECSGSESLLSSCLTGHNLPPGLVNCNHSMDVSIQCQGVSVVVILS